MIKSIMSGGEPPNDKSAAPVLEHQDGKRR